MSENGAILVIEDEKGISSFMKASLTANGYDVLLAATAAEGLMMVPSHCPDLVLLDLGLPDMDGLDIIRAVRAWSQIPILVVSARTQERDKVRALDLGADDYITKPFGVPELLARVRTALRHAAARTTPNNAPAGEFCCGGLSINFDKRRVTCDGEEIHLTQNEYKIVSLLAQHAGRVLTYEHLLTAIWGPNLTGDNQILRVHMAHIRRKIEKNPAAPCYIFTETGVGYRMAEAEE